MADNDKHIANDGGKELLARIGRRDQRMPTGKKHMYLPILLGWVLPILFSGRSYAQGPDSLLNRTVATWSRYSDHHQAPGLFLHLDKSVYGHGEHIQFTAYLFTAAADTVVYHTLYATVVDLAKGTTAVFERFALYRGVGAGALYLADSLEAGEYLVAAYTGDRLDSLSQPVFRQQVTLLPDAAPPFVMTQWPDSFPPKFRITTDYRGLASGGSFRYQLRSAGWQSGPEEKKIDPFGEVTLPLPAKDTFSGNMLLTATVTRNGLVRHFRMPVVTGPAEWRARYYPEGGNLLDGQPGVIGVEVRDRSGRGVPTNGRLLEDGRPVASFRTDGNGWGRLICEAHTGHSYNAEYTDLPPKVRVTGDFPAILPEGYGLHVADGVVRDTVSLELHMPAPGRRCLLLIYNDRELAYASTLLARSADAHMKIPVTGWPAGLLTMTLFGDRGVPVAERRIFSGSSRLTLTVSPDSATYHTRSKVRLRIHTTDDKGEGVKTLFSLSSVLANRWKKDAAPDIVRYVLLDQYLAGDPSSENILPPLTGHWQEDSVIGLLLLTRCWTRYHWKEVVADSLPVPAPAHGADYGYVLFNGKRPKEPVRMLVLGGPLLQFNTDSAGRFGVPAVDLLSPMGGNLALSLAGGAGQEEYRIFLNNEYDSANRLLAGAWYPPQPGADEAGAGEEKNDQTKGRSVRTLQKVVVRPGRDGGNGGCRDYVCLMGILNCPNHPYGSKPVIGMVYRVNTGDNQYHEVIYRGCRETENILPPFVRRLKAIYVIKESYEGDTLAIRSPAPALYTTLHWSPVAITDEKGYADISFYTNDLPGLFYNIAQGISTLGPVCGKESFRVIP